MRITNISPLNQFRFAPYEFQGQPEHHSIPYEKGLAFERFRKGSIPKIYAQKHETYDMADVFLMTNSNYAGGSFATYARLRVVDCTETDVMPVVYFDESAFGDMTVLRKSSSWLFDGLDDGIYYILIEVDYPAEGSVPMTTERFISEPIWIKDSWPDTVLIEYFNSYNKRGVVFDYPYKTKFRLRVEGDILEMQPKIEKTVFVDQGHNERLVRATAYKNWVLSVGANGTSVADWIGDRLNEIVGCDKVFIDGKRYSVGEETQVERLNDDGYHLGGYKVVFGEWDNGKAGRHTEGPITLLYLPATFPYALHDLTIGYEGYHAYYSPVRAMITSTGMLSGYIGIIQADMNAAGLGGTLSYIGGHITYTPSIYEDYDTGSVGLMTKYISLDITGTAGSGTLTNLWLGGVSAGMRGIAFSQPFVPIADRTFATAEDDFLLARMAEIGGGDYTKSMSIGVSHTSTGVVNVKVFFDSDIKGHLLRGYAVTGYDLSEKPLQLKEFWINRTSITAFNLQTMLFHAPLLKRLWLTENPSLSNIIGYYIPPPSLGWAALKEIYFLGNNISAYTMDSFLNEMLDADTDGHFGIYNGDIRITQTPDVVATSASAAARAMLSSYSWFVGIST